MGLTEGRVSEALEHGQPQAVWHVKTFTKFAMRYSAVRELYSVYYDDCQYARLLFPFFVF